MNLEDMSKIFEITQKIEKIIIDSGLFTLNTKEYTLKSLEEIMIFTVNLSLNKIDTSLKIEFLNLGLRRIQIRSSPGFVDQSRSIIKHENGYYFDLSKLVLPISEIHFEFEIEYEIEKIIKDLVKRDHKVEASGEFGDKYWLHAQLKQIDPIERIMNRLSLNDIPFTVDVGIYQDIKTKFSKRREQELDIIARWTMTVDRVQKDRLNREHLRHRIGRRNEKEIAQILTDMQSLFNPETFKRFIVVEKDFYYDRCYRGADFYDKVPFKTFPKWMSVISRTDLTLDKPAATGELLYKKFDFQEAFENVMTKKEKPPHPKRRKPTEI